MLYLALALAGFTIVFGARQLDCSECHEGMVAAIALEARVGLTVAFAARPLGHSLVQARGAVWLASARSPDASFCHAVRADPDRLRQVMLNLLSNAAKFVPTPGGRPWLHSAPGQGACFGFDLPLCGAAGTAQSAPEPEPEPEPGDRNHEPHSADRR